MSQTINFPATSSRRLHAARKMLLSGYAREALELARDGASACKFANTRAPWLALIAICQREIIRIKNEADDKEISRQEKIQAEHRAAIAAQHASDMRRAEWLRSPACADHLAMLRKMPHSAAIQSAIAKIERDIKLTK